MAGMAGAFAWIWFMVDKQGDELQTQVQTVVDREVFAKQFDQLIKTVEATERERENLEQFILQNDTDTIALLSELDKIASEHGVELSTRELTVETTKEEFDRLILKYDLVGREESVIKIIKMLETLPYHGEISGLTLNRNLIEETNETELVAGVSLLLSIKKYDQ